MTHPTEAGERERRAPAIVKTPDEAFGFCEGCGEYVQAEWGNAHDNEWGHGKACHPIRPLPANLLRTEPSGEVVAWRLRFRPDPLMKRQDWSEWFYIAEDPVEWKEGFMGRKWKDVEWEEQPLYLRPTTIQ